MRNLFLLILILFSTTMCNSNPKEPVVLIQTSYGDIKVKLYNETPIHRDNFLQLAESGFYKDMIFHRVIRDFMIQGGSPEVKTNLSPDERKLERDTIPAEIKFPMFFHKKGALAAARWGDAENPTKASDKYQFYIVTGEIQSDENLYGIEKQHYERLKQQIYNSLQSDSMDTIKAMYKEGNREGISQLKSSMLEHAEKEAKARESQLFYTTDQRNLYKTIGGTPHLDNEYTVFGEVIEGMDVVDKIQQAKTDGRDKPLSDIIINAVVVPK